MLLWGFFGYFLIVVFYALCVFCVIMAGCFLPGCVVVLVFGVLIFVFLIQMYVLVLACKKK